MSIHPGKEVIGRVLLPSVGVYSAFMFSWICDSALTSLVAGSISQQTFDEAWTVSPKHVGVTQVVNGM